MAITIKPDPLETSPLLSHPQHQRPDHDINGHGDSNAGYRVDLENSQPPELPSAEEDNAVTVDEPSTRMLVAIMTASWIGVFFAALGMYKSFSWFFLRDAQLLCEIIPNDILIPITHASPGSLLWDCSSPACGHDVLILSYYLSSKTY